GPGWNLAVERAGVPVADLETVVALPCRPARHLTEVFEVRQRTSRLVFVVARHRERPALVPAPRVVIAIAILLSRPLEIRVVAQREDIRSGERIEECRCRQRVAIAHGDVAGAD